MYQTTIIHLAADHAGLHLKELIKSWLKEWGYSYEDHGAFESNETDDYPDFVMPAAQAVSKVPLERAGIIIGGSGQGEAMAANRFPNVRAAVYYGGNLDIIHFSREHNDSNILSLGARFISENEAYEAIKLWLETQFTKEERHARRIRKIEEFVK